MNEEREAAIAKLLKHVTNGDREPDPRLVVEFNRVSPETKIPMTYHDAFRFETVEGDDIREFLDEYLTLSPPDRRERLEKLLCETTRGYQRRKLLALESRLETIDRPTGDERQDLYELVKDLFRQSPRERTKNRWEWLGFVRSVDLELLRDANRRLLQYDPTIDGILQCRVQDYFVNESTNQFVDFPKSCEFIARTTENTSEDEWVLTEEEQYRWKHDLPRTIAEFEGRLYPPPLTKYDRWKAHFESTVFFVQRWMLIILTSFVVIALSWSTLMFFVDYFNRFR